MSQWWNRWIERRVNDLEAQAAGVVAEFVLVIERPCADRDIMYADELAAAGAKTLFASGGGGAVAGLVGAKDPGFVLHGSGTSCMALRTSSIVAWV